jgi:DNA uptake protein ComE-like DNA-binding protein
LYWLAQWRGHRNEPKSEGKEFYELIDYFSLFRAASHRESSFWRVVAPCPQTPLQQLLGPAKSSLIVNINTASAQELESLPSIGSSRAEQIIAHRPYASVDELSQVKGITPRVIDQLRPFVKTDGATEKIK